MAIGSSKMRAHTEKVTKDVASDLAGEVRFAELLPEEKTDRQGNTTTTAARGGLIWILSGEVYNLPPGAEPVVSNGDRTTPGKIPAFRGGVHQLPLRHPQRFPVVVSSQLPLASTKIASSANIFSALVFASLALR